MTGDDGTCSEDDHRNQSCDGTGGTREARRDVESLEECVDDETKRDDGQLTPADPKADRTSDLPDPTARQRDESE